MKPRIETWFAVYKKCPKDGWVIVAIFREEEDANAYHCNPEMYFVSRRRVRFCLNPIQTLEAQACAILHALVNGPDEKIGKALDEAKAFLKTLPDET